MTPADLLSSLRARARRARGSVRDAGASALEFAIIAAVVVLASSVIGAVVYNVVTGKKDQLEQCANQAVNVECAPSGGGGGGGGGGLAP